MLKSIGFFLAKQLKALFNFLVRLLSSLLGVLWDALAKVFSSLFSLLGTIFGRLLATLSLIMMIALSPLVAIVKSTASSFATMLGPSPDVISAFFPNNFQALCYVAVNYCSLDIMLSALTTYLAILGLCYSVKVSVWAARKAASVTRGAGV